MLETAAESTVQAILFYHRSPTFPDQAILTVIFTLSGSSSKEITVKSVFPPAGNPAFVGLKCTETLMTYQMTPKYKFNGF